MTENSPLRAYRTRENVTLAAIAAKLGVNKATVLRWEQRGVSAERAVDIERVTNGAVPRWAMRPDIYSAPPGVI